MKYLIILAFVFIGSSVKGQEVRIVRDSTANKITKFAVQKVYPSPFGSSLYKLKFDIQDSSFVNLTFYDMYGNEVIEFYNGVLTQGAYTIHWNQSTSEGKIIPTGIYFLRMKAQILRNDRYYLPIDIHEKYIVIW
jgi:hypothetical protein